MLGRIVLIASACLCALALVPAGAAAYEKGLYTTSGTYTLVWEEASLQVEAHVTGEATRESEVWEACSFCLRPPEVDFPLPRGLTIRVSERCLSGGWSFLANPVRTVIPAPAPGTATKEVVTFDVTETFRVWAEEAPFSHFCLVHNVSTSYPNEECAEFFAPDLCATEYGTNKYVMGTGELTYLPTRTADCGPAKSAARRALARINRLAGNLRRKPGFQPAQERRLDRLQVLYRYGDKERVLGQCK